MNFAGQRCAKLNRDQAIYDVEKSHRSALITIVSPLLFFAPDVHLNSLERVWIDEMINQVPWKSMISKLNEDWREFILFSTVLRKRNPIVTKTCTDSAQSQPTRLCSPFRMSTMSHRWLETLFKSSVTRRSLPALAASYLDCY
jgi:hypothetical protein